MAFKFNFFSDETGTKEETPKSKLELLDKNVTKVDLSSLKSVPYYSNSTIRTLSGNEFHLSLNPNFEELTKMHSMYPGAKTEEQTTKLSDWFKGPSDLIPGVYEGGFRLWEGAGDLVEYLTNQKLEFSDKLVLELGTGIGLPGILALRKGAKVWFQEYNIEVLECGTIPHCFMNIGSHDDVFKNATFLSGSWSNLVPYFEENSLKFDIILMAETIYEVSHYGTLLDIVNQTLTPNGRVVIAAKQTYFGLSGSTRGFKDFVAQRRTFQCSTVVTIESNIPRVIDVVIPESTDVDLEELAIEIGAEDCSVQNDGESTEEFWQFKMDLESFQIASQHIRDKEFKIIEQRTEFFPRTHSELTADQFQEASQVVEKLNAMEDATGIFDNISCKELDIEGSAIAY